VRRGLLVLIIALLAVGCSSGDADNTEPSQFPTGSVRAWFDALDAGEAVAALDLTHQPSMLVLLAAENDLPAADLASLLRRGATEESAGDYLLDFANALRSRYERSLAEVTVDGFTQLGDTYAAVAVTGEGAATIITRRAPGGLWQVDLTGTLGPALITQIRTLLEGTGEGEDGLTIQEAFQSSVVPALEAAAAADPENLALAAEIRAIKGLLSG